MPATSSRGSAVVSIAEARASRRRAHPKEVTCLCCMAHHVITLVSVMTFLLGLVSCLGGVFLNQRTANWEVKTVDMLGWLCIFVGAFLTITSLLGIMAARSGKFIFLFAYFSLLLLLLASMLLAAVFAYFENARLREYLRANWDAIQERLGFGDVIGGEDGELTFDEAVELMRSYLLVIGGVGAGAVVVLGTAFVSVMRMLGLKAIATSLLITLGVLGVGEAGIAYETLGKVPKATTILLFGCAGVQLLAGATGCCGVRMLNRECICLAMLILVLATAGLGWVSVATYLWLRDTTPAEPEHLMLVFGIASVADFFMLVTLLFVLCLYRKLRKALTQSERSRENREEYSDYATRQATARRNKRKKGKGRSTAEYLPDDHL